MNMKRTIALVLTIAICATMALGGTLAFLTDTEEEVNIMTVGRVDIKLIEQQRAADDTLEDFEDGNQLLPVVGSAQGAKDAWGMPTAKNYVDKIVNVENIGNTPAYVRVLVGIPAALEGEVGTANENPLHWSYGNRFDPNHGGEYNDGSTQSDWNPEYLKIEYSSIPVSTAMVDGIEYNVYAFTYQEALNPKTITGAPAIVGFYLDERVDWDDETGKYYMGEKIPENEIKFDLSKGVKIPVMAQAVQAEGFENATEAFKASGLTVNPWNGKSFATPAVVGSVEALNAAVAAGQDIILDDNLNIEDVIVLNGSDFDGNGKTINSNIDFSNSKYTDPAILATEGLVENVEVIGAGRGIGTRGKLTGDLTVRNVRTDGGSYALHAQVGNGYSLLVEDSFLHGWVSYGNGFKSVTFNNVHFSKNSTPSDYNGIRAYSNTTFAYCAFDEGVTLDVDGNATEIVLQGCTYNGVAITAANLADLLAEDDEYSLIKIIE